MLSLSYNTLHCCRRELQGILRTHQPGAESILIAGLGLLLVNSRCAASQVCPAADGHIRDTTIGRAEGIIP